jgi:hypothetical protein
MYARREVVVAARIVIFFSLVAEAQAVAFKVHNQSSYKFRMRVHDRGNWREWVDVPAGFWGVTGEKVERTEHDVEIDVFTTKEGKPDAAWVPFYRGHHGSRVFTRVLHIFEFVASDQQRTVVMTWNDEPPGCRDKPVFEGGQFKNGCLLRSGWSEDLLKRAAIKIGETVIRAIIAGG